MEAATLPDSEPESGPGWAWRGLLAAPFLVCLTVLLATGWTFPTFWGWDEVNHWALIRWFAKGLPRFKAAYPCTATTPLFHLAGACLVRLFGLNLQAMRACNTLLSIGGVLALFGILRRSLKHEKATAALLCAVFGSSSYYFGYSFRVLTDNMAIVGCLLAMGKMFRFVDPAEENPLGCYLRGCFWCGLTILTRQSYIFLCLPCGMLLLALPLQPRAKFAGLGGLALALTPFAALVVAWRGLVPPDYQLHHTPSFINLYPLALPLMLLGLYTPFFLGPALWRWFRAGALGWRRCLGPGAAAAVALGALSRYPLVPVPGHPELNRYFPAPSLDNWSAYFGGSIYSVADRFARLSFCHNSFLFWLALPLGAAAAAWFLPAGWRVGDRRRQVSALFLLSVLFSSLLNPVSAQKYYDGLILLFLVWHSPGEAARDAWRRRVLGCLILIFCVYAATFPFLSNNFGLPFKPLPPLPPPP